MLKIRAVKDFKGRPTSGFGRCEGRVEQLRKKNPAQKKCDKKNRKQRGSAGNNSCKAHFILSKLENRLVKKGIPRESSFFMGRRGWGI